MFIKRKLKRGNYAEMFRFLGVFLFLAFDYVHKPSEGSVIHTVESSASVYYRPFSPPSQCYVTVPQWQAVLCLVYICYGFYTSAVLNDMYTIMSTIFAVGYHNHHKGDWQDMLLIHMQILHSVAVLSRFQRQRVLFDCMINALPLSQ